MNVRDFLDVRVICEAGSLRKAAAVLGVTQPTLSNRIARLEDQLGAPLFDRSRGQSQPTDLALFIARRAATISDDARQLAEEARRLSSGKGGLVRVGVAPGPSRIVVPDVVVSISTRFPSISLDLLCAPTVQLAESLVKRRLDMIVCPDLEGDHAAVESELLLETDIVIVARPDHPLCADPPASIMGLFKYPVALPIAEKQYFDMLKQDYGIDVESVQGRILCSDPAMLARIVQKSERLVGAAPKFYFGPELEAGLLRVVETPVPFRHQLYMHWNRDAYPVPSVTRVQDALREAFRLF